MKRACWGSSLAVRIACAVLRLLRVSGVLFIVLLLMLFNCITMLSPSPAFFVRARQLFKTFGISGIPRGDSRSALPRNGFAFSNLFGGTWCRRDIVINDAGHRVFQPNLATKKVWAPGLDITFKMPCGW